MLILDYFISGVRKKVEDLCGCNDALIYPLQQTFKPTPETFGSQNNEEEKTEGDIRSQGATKAFGTQATINLKDSIDKKSHSIWTECTLNISIRKYVYTNKALKSW